MQRRTNWCRSWQHKVLQRWAGTGLGGMGIPQQPGKVRLDMSAFYCISECAEHPSSPRVFTDILTSTQPAWDQWIGLVVDRGSSNGAARKC